MSSATAIMFGSWAASIALAPSWSMKAALTAPAVLVPLSWWTLARPSRWIVLFFAAALLLPPLPIPMGDSGPHPSLLFAAIGLLAGLLRVGEWRLHLSGVHQAMLVLFGILLASVGMAAVNSGIAVAAGSLARVGLFGISLYVFFFAVGQRHALPISYIRPVYWFAVTSALFACVDFYFQFPAPAGYGPQFVWLSSGVFRRAQGFFYEASTLGNFCAFFLVMIAVALVHRPLAPRPPAPGPWPLTPALLLGGAIFFAALVLSYSRASVLNLLVALSVLAWLNRRRIRFLRPTATLVLLILAASFLTWRVFPAFAEMYWLRLSGTAEWMFAATEGVLSGRVASWRTLGAWLAANPWQALVGIGYKTLPYTDYLGAPLVADNMYLSLLVETGVAGLAALVWLNMAILRAAAQSAASADVDRSFFGTWILCFWAGQTVQMASGDLLTYWRVLPLYFWVLALAMRK